MNIEEMAKQEILLREASWMGIDNFGNMFLVHGYMRLY